MLVSPCPLRIPFYRQTCIMATACKRRSTARTRQALPSVRPVPADLVYGGRGAPPFLQYLRADLFLCLHASIGAVLACLNSIVYYICFLPTSWPHVARAVHVSAPALLTTWLEVGRLQEAVLPSEHSAYAQHAISPPHISAAAIG